MRLTDFIQDLRARFPEIDTDEDLRRDIADAMQEANDTGWGVFNYDDMPYKIEARWYDGCLSGNCNPATCWTDWTISTD